MGRTAGAIAAALIFSVTLNVSSCASLKRATGWGFRSSESAGDSRQERKIPLPPMVEDFESQAPGDPERAR